MAQEVEQHLKKIRFTKGLRGYTCEEVDTYLAYVNDRYNTLAKECSELRKKMTVMAAGANEYREDALRDKEQIVAEAEELVRQKTKEADELTGRAKRKAATMLQEAETKAAEILRQAEVAAENILSAREAERQAVLQSEAENTLTVARQEAGELIARQNRRAERLVEEMDSFRESVFAMYSRHIEELEKLAGETDDFYQTKDEIVAEAMADTGISIPDATAEVSEMPDAEEIYEPAEADGLLEPEADRQFEDMVVPEVVAPEELAEEPLRIDWKAHRVSREEQPAIEAEPEEEWEVPEDADTAGEEEFLVDNLFSSYEEPEEGVDEAEEAEPVPVKPQSEEDYLSDLASTYFTPAPKKPVSSRPVPETEPKAEPVRGDTTIKNKELEELFYEEGEEVSLTGEFDKIFNTKNSAANVTQISRQPLVAPQKPDKRAAKQADRHDRSKDRKNG